MFSKVDRRLQLAVGAACVSVVIAACGAASSASQPSAAGTDNGGTATSGSGGGSAALTIGFVSSLSGTHAGPGGDMLNGFKLYLKEHSNMLGNRAVKLLPVDDQSSPDTGIQVTKRLVEQSHVDLVVGPLLANVGLAMGNYISTTKTPMFYPIPASGAFLRQRPSNMFIAGTAAQDTHPAGAWASAKGYKKALTICSDYAFGYEQCGGFANTFTDGGGQITQQLWAPLGTTDFGPYVSQMRAGGFDIIYDGVVGADSVRFVQALAQSGLSGKYPVLAGLAPTDQDLINSMGSAAKGLLSVGHYASGNPDQVTKGFATKYEAAYGNIPGYYSASGYFAGQWLSAALTKSESGPLDVTTFFDALKKANLTASVFGDVTIDPNGNVVWPEYLREVTQRADGKFWQTPKETLGPASVNWHYDYNAFIKQPTYAREYQGIDWPQDCKAYADACPAFLKTK